MKNKKNLTIIIITIGLLLLCFIAFLFLKNGNVLINTTSKPKVVIKEAFKEKLKINFNSLHQEDE